MESSRRSGHDTRTEIRMSTVEERLAALEAQLSGRSFLSRIPELGVALDGVVARVADVPGDTTIKQAVLAALSGSITPAPNVQVPPPVSLPPAPIGAYDLPIQAMTQTQIDALIPALQAGLNTGLSQAQIDRIKSELAQGVYSICDSELIGSIKYWFYAQAGADQAAIKPYLSAIDQRVMTDPGKGDALLPTDPRVVHVSGIPGVGTPAPLPPTIGGDTYLPGRVGVGGYVKEIYGMIGQFFGRGDASLYLEANGDGSGPQLAGKLAVFDISVSGGDGGGRLRQNRGADGKSADGIRPMGVVGFDSQSTLSGQQRKPGEESIYGQDWWLIVNHANKTVDLVSPQPGYKLRIMQTPAGAGYADSTDIR